MGAFGPSSVSHGRAEQTDDLAGLKIVQRMLESPPGWPLNLTGRAHGPDEPVGQPAHRTL